MLTLVTNPVPSPPSHVWLCIPSARPAPDANKSLERWRAMGYRIALHCDTEDDARDKIKDAYIAAPYPGYALASNRLIAGVLLADPKCDWVVCGGDDVWPDDKHAPEQIAHECRDHFSFMFMERTGTPHDIARSMAVGSLGVMQPTGDPFAGRQIERICGSPWIGREFCERAYRGTGPFYHEYLHVFVDEEIQNVAINLGCFWQRRDLTHYHDHALRIGDVADHGRPLPLHLREGDGKIGPFSKAHWVKFEKLFFDRRAAGFPGHELLPVGGEVSPGIPYLVGEGGACG